MFPHTERKANDKVASAPIRSRRAMLSPVIAMKFVHAADLHIDSPLRGLARYEGAPIEAVRGATRRAMQNLVDLCLEEGAAFLLIAGDIYDGDWKDYGTGLFFLNQLDGFCYGQDLTIWFTLQKKVKKTLTFIPG